MTVRPPVQEGADAVRQDVGNRMPLEHADIVVGLPSFNNAGTVKDVVQAVVAGLRQSFPSATVLLVNEDAGSQDGTPELVKEAVQDRLPTAFLTGKGSVVAGMDAFPLSRTWMSGREESFRSFFSAATQTGAAACAVIDPAVRSVTPDWMNWLLSPIIEANAEYVAPLFLRPRYEGSLTNTLVYPLNRALFGTAMRYHTGGGCGLSGPFAGRLLERDFWEDQATRHGIESCLATVAVAERRSLCQAGLGEKVMPGPPGGEDLSAVLAQAVGSVFYFMERYQDVWEHPVVSQPVPHVGLPYKLLPDRGTINVDRMIRGFRQGLRDLLPIWEIILSPETLSAILPLGLVEKEEFRFPPPLWAQTVYDFALAYHEKALHREHLLKSLTPLYLGQVASLVLRTQERKPEDVEECIEELCGTFARMKPYLVERWRFS